MKFYDHHRGPLSKLKLSRTARMIRFPLLGMMLGVQAPVFGRPRSVYKYNDGATAFMDFGPIRFYRYFWREGK